MTRLIEWSHSRFVDKNKLYAMGWGADGQLGLGNGSTSDRSTPSLIAGLDGRRVRKLASSTDFTMALLGA
ncbi:hypothetical protein BC936DRAFT_147992 [Jimgerdemannia flammicorona]|uniref:Regulator of chromosome condensation 1/beta-lactamase-inhibitor protein II n=1 Tax=Jimgerdemannia flammicorona TaxID=994334 RepID=A0A433D3Y8_9FUNG|nr:hypothetical protein BC936DRAFT_147992 [Jimgerdemannia flammicorona]